jgi:hypothetical protein
MEDLLGGACGNYATGFAWVHPSLQQLDEGLVAAVQAPYLLTS